MRIERLENSKRKQERVLVHLEDGNILRITGAELLQFGLYQGLDLTPETLAALEAAARRSDTKRRGANMAAGRMLSKKELTSRLTKKGAAPEDAADTADWLEELGAVDDAAYAGVIARHYGGMATAPPASGRSCTAGAYPRSCGTRRWSSCRRRRRPSVNSSAPSCGDAR